MNLVESIKNGGSLLDYWVISKNYRSIALTIGLLGFAKLNRKIANCNFLLSIALGQIKSTIMWVNSAIDFLEIKK